MSCPPLGGLPMHKIFIFALFVMQLSKPLQDTVLKGTYNRTLNNPLKGEEEIRTGGGRFNVKETIIISNE